MKIVKQNLYADIKYILEQARKNAVKAVNFSMVVAYWQIGQRIVEEEQGGSKKANYGQYLLKDLAAKLTVDFGKGYTLTNLKYFRQFYLVFPGFSIGQAVSDQLKNNLIPLKSHAVGDQFAKKQKQDAVRPELGVAIINKEKHYTLRSELSWTHYRLLLKVENEAARKYYMNEAAEQNWNTRNLERQINSLYFERMLSSKNKKALIQKTAKEAQQDAPTILDFVKDPYILEFLSLNPNATLYEKELETELLNKLQSFLLELGKGFSFVARQKRISADGEHFFIDLVFYNYILKCFVLIDLKAGKLSHQDIGQMDLYVRYYEEEIKQKTDNPTIGLILCTEKNATIVKYSVLKESKQLFASKYKLYLPSEKELIAELNAELQQLKNKKMK
jgi:predicted nuclease of restriction endonuclease-like (RecB) superfamily